MEEIRNIRIEKGRVYLDGVLGYTHDDTEVRAFTKRVYGQYGITYAKFYKMSPLSRLGFVAAELLLKDQDLSGIDREKVSIILANSSSSLHTDEIYQETIKSKPSPAIFVYTLPNIVIGEICIRQGFKGEGIFLIQEEYDREMVYTCAENQLKMHPGSISLAGWIELDREGDYLADLCLLK